MGFPTLDALEHTEATGSQVLVSDLPFSQIWQWKSNENFKKMENSYMLCLVGMKMDKKKRINFFFNLLFLFPDNEELNTTMPKKVA